MKRRIIPWICCILLLPIVTLSLSSFAPVSELPAAGGGTVAPDPLLTVKLSSFADAWQDLFPLLVEWQETPDGTQASRELVASTGFDTNFYNCNIPGEYTPVKARLIRNYSDNIQQRHWDVTDVWEGPYYDAASEMLTLFVPNAVGPEERAMIQAGKLSLVFICRAISATDADDPREDAGGMACLAYTPGDDRNGPALGALEVKDGRIVVQESRAQWILYGGLFEAGNIQIRTHLHADGKPSDGVPFFRDGMPVEEFWSYLEYQRSLNDAANKNDMNWETVHPWTSA